MPQEERMAVSSWWLYASVTDFLRACRKSLECTVQAQTKVFPLPDWTWQGNTLFWIRIERRRQEISQSLSRMWWGKLFRCKFYIKSAGVVHPFVRERTGKRHLLFRKTIHHLDLQSLLVGNADFAEVYHCLHQVLFCSLSFIVSEISTFIFTIGCF